MKTYPERLLEIGINLLEPYTHSKAHAKMQCLTCLHEWSATPLSKLQNFKKHGAGGCPKCTHERRYTEKQESNKASLPTYIEVVSDWDGNRNFARGKETFRNTLCGHEFVTYPNYILAGKTECTVCGEYERVEELKKRNKERRTDQNYDAWMEYKNRVGYLTRKTYTANIETLNPNSYPIGLCGLEGHYQIDHILPKSLAYKLGISEELVSHVDNLQVIPWEQNREHSDELKAIPLIFREYFNKDAVI